MFLDVRCDPKTKALEVAAYAKPNQIFHFKATQSTPLSWQARKSVVDARIGTAKAVRFADIDNNGQPDLVATNEQAKNGRTGVFWFPLGKLRKPTITQISDISGSKGVKFDRIETVDLDDDGDLDVITCEEVDNLGVIWYENPIN
ncbi:MAG: hypothetical protein M2R45_04196 [Verrucomicrobia subdivision 3 bacterium]|nr:hypothetical protein [Limisphaerales bacterium]MCS1417067.1 hypothetical protein [Limisphaerales bacterium]